MPCSEDTTRRMSLACDGVGNARGYDRNSRCDADRFMNGGCRGMSHFGDLLGDGRKQCVVATLDRKITRQDIVPARTARANARGAGGQ